MIVLRKTMEAAIDAEREKAAKERQAFYGQYGHALHQVAAVQYQLAAWVTGKADAAFTPEQFAALFWQNDDRFQAAFFNALPDAIQAHRDALPVPMPGEYRGMFSRDGEGQWAWMVDHLSDEGFAVLESMVEMAKLNRERAPVSQPLPPSSGEVG